MVKGSEKETAEGSLGAPHPNKCDNIQSRPRRDNERYSFLRFIDELADCLYVRREILVVPRIETSSKYGRGFFISSKGVELMKPLEIVSYIIIAIGFVVVYGAKTIVKKYDLAQKQKCENVGEMTEEEFEQYKLNKATVNVKMLGLVISIPGLILFIVSR